MILVTPMIIKTGVPIQMVMDKVVLSLMMIYVPIIRVPRVVLIIAQIWMMNVIQITMQITA
jgi:hypothetical protein